MKATDDAVCVAVHEVVDRLEDMGVDRYVITRGPGRTITYKYLASAAIDDIELEFSVTL